MMAKKSRGKAKKHSKAKKAKAKKKVSKKAKKSKSGAKKAKKPVSKRAKTQKKAVKKAAKKPKRGSIIKRAVSSLIKHKVSSKPNLLVTYDPNHKGTAEAEIKEVFKKIGMPFEFSGSDVSDVEGLFKLRTSDAKEAVRKLNELCTNSPELFTTTHRYIPIEAWCSSGVADMQGTIKRFIGEIGNDEKWKMSLNKRKWDKMHTTQLVLTLTEVIDKPNVDLVNPEKIIQVEIIGEEAGISILKPNETLDVSKIKGPMF